MVLGLMTYRKPKGSWGTATCQKTGGHREGVEGESPTSRIHGLGRRWAIAGAAREGAALLQGLATCGMCGRKLATTPPWNRRHPQPAGPPHRLLAYYAVPGNTDAVAAFRTQVTRR
jgi:hypothetical protein